MREDSCSEELLELPGSAVTSTTDSSHHRGERQVVILALFFGAIIYSSWYSSAQKDFKPLVFKLRDRDFAYFLCVFFPSRAPPATSKALRSQSTPDSLQGSSATTPVPRSSYITGLSVRRGQIAQRSKRRKAILLIIAPRLQHKPQISREKMSPSPLIAKERKN